MYEESNGSPKKIFSSWKPKSFTRQTELFERKVLKFLFSLQSIWKIMTLQIRNRKHLQLAWTTLPAVVTISTGKSFLDMQLHVSNDASECALASVAFFRITYDNILVEVKFIIEKVRVAPSN